MLPIDINAIEVADLQRLIDESVIETRNLEYKEILPSNSDGDKKEFLADISSFANSNGGDLIYGIREEDHRPIELVGVHVDDVDEKQRQLEAIIRDGISPRIPNIKPKFIQVDTDLFAILFRIPKSWLNPHMVTFRNSSKFFTRASNGKYQMDIEQIRSAFSLSESKIARIREFVLTRLSDVLSDETPIPLTRFPKICMHIIPLSSIESPMVENFSQRNIGSISPLCRSGSNPAYIADGYLSYSPIQENGGSSGYVLVFRNGAIEAVSSFLSNLKTEPVLPLEFLENQIIGGVKNYSKRIKILGLDPPAYVFIHLIGVKGLTLSRSGRFAGFDDCLPIQKDLIALPNFELLIYGIEDDEAECEYLTQILKLPFDAMANAVGLPHSISYNRQGIWIR